MRFFVGQLESGLFIYMPRGMETVLRPQRDLVIAAFTREVETRVHQRLPHAHPARRRLNQQYTQLRDFVRLAYQEDAPEKCAALFRDPATLASRIEVANKLRANL